MKQIVVLIRESQPGERFSDDPFDVREAAMAALDRCRELGYTAAEGVVTDIHDDVLQHSLLNVEKTILRIYGETIMQSDL